MNLTWEAQKYLRLREVRKAFYFNRGGANRGNLGAACKQFLVTVEKLPSNASVFVADRRLFGIHITENW